MARGDFRVTPEETQSDSLLGALGISEDRCRELSNIVHQLHTRSETSSISQIMCEVSGYCENTSELAFVCYILGAEVAGGAAFEAGMAAAKILGDAEPFVGRSMTTRQTPPTGMLIRVHLSEKEMEV